MSNIFENLYFYLLSSENNLYLKYQYLKLILHSYTCPKEPRNTMQFT